VPTFAPSRWIRLLLKLLGPGVITGAADDDPSGIATYSVAGARLGTELTLDRPLHVAADGCAVNDVCPNRQGNGARLGCKFQARRFPINKAWETSADHCNRVIELKCTAWKSPVLRHSGYDNENDSGIPRRRAPKRLRRSAADRSRSRAHPVAEPWPPSHCETSPAGIAIFG
jgi:hypothetical protein